MRTNDSEPELTFSYPGGSFSVTTPDEPTLDWLADFLTPSFHIVPGHGPNARIFLKDNHGLFDQLRAKMERSESRSMTCFTRDGSFASFPAMNTHLDGFCLYDQQNLTFYRILPHSRHVELIPAKAQTQKARRKSLLRVAREIASVQAIDGETLPIHGSCFAVDGHAVVLCGPKRSGKTTLLMHTLQRGASFISNDRVSVSSCQGLPVVHGMPTIVNVRTDSLDYFPGLASRFAVAPAFDRDSREDGHLTISATPKNGPIHDVPDGDGGRLVAKGLTPRRFCWLLGRRPISNVPLRSIVFPRIDSSVSGVTINAIDRDRAMTLLRQSVLAPGRTLQLPEAFSAFANSCADFEEMAGRLCRLLVRHAACYVCTLGPNAYCDGLLGQLAA